MNKTELILSIAEETGFSRKNVEIALNAAIARITKALTEEEKVQIVGFGAFETKTRAVGMVYEQFSVDAKQFVKAIRITLCNALHGSNTMIPQPICCALAHPPEVCQGPMLP